MRCSCEHEAGMAEKVRVFNMDAVKTGAVVGCHAYLVLEDEDGDTMTLEMSPEQARDLIAGLRMHADHVEGRRAVIKAAAEDPKGPGYLYPGREEGAT